MTHLPAFWYHHFLLYSSSAAAFYQSYSDLPHLFPLLGNPYDQTHFEQLVWRLKYEAGLFPGGPCPHRCSASNLAEDYLVQHLKWFRKDSTDQSKKLKGHVYYTEDLHIGLFMDPRYWTLLLKVSILFFY